VIITLLSNCSQIRIRLGALIYTNTISVPVIGCLGGIATPEVRAMMSEIVDSSEQGVQINVLPRF
jgi:hypothetical protein